MSKSLIKIILGITSIIIIIILMLIFFNNNQNNTHKIYNEHIYEEDRKQECDTIDAAIKKVLLDESTSYYDGEFSACSYKILKEDMRVIEKNGEEVVRYIEYLLTTVGNYGFENGIFTKVSGSGVIPMVIEFEYTDDARYILVSKKVPLDGNKYTDSIKSMFPISLHSKIFSSNDEYDELVKQEISSAKEYLINIERNADVKEHVEKQLLELNIEFENEIFDVFYNYPYWLGNFERIEDGKRVVYETSFDKYENMTNSEGIINFTKYEYEDKENYIERYSYEVNKDGTFNCILSECKNKNSTNHEVLRNYVENKIIDAYTGLYDDVCVNFEFLEDNISKNEISIIYNVNITYHFKNYKNAENEIPYLLKLKEQKSSNYEVMKEEYQKEQESNVKLRIKASLDNKYKKLLFRNLDTIIDGVRRVSIEMDNGVKNLDEWSDFYNHLEHLNNVKNYLATSDDYDPLFQNMHEDLRKN